MRKVDNSTSQDGADTSSITSAIENEVKKASGLKTKRTSIKRKMPNFSHESDETVIEPLLQSEKEKTDTSKSAKFLMSKSKTDSGSERSDSVFIETKIEKCSPTSITPLSESISYTSKVKEAPAPKVTAPIYNHMNTNVFGGLEVKAVPTKSAVIVEIEKTKGSTYTPGPLIFTTAKIHTDSKTKQMEPVQITPVPILSTIEGSVVKSVSGIIDNVESSRELINLKNEVQRKEEHLQKSVKVIASTSVIDSAGSRHEAMKPKSEVQRKEHKDNEQIPIMAVVSTKSSLNLGTSSSDTQANLKTTVTSGKDKTMTSPTTATVFASKPPQSVMDNSPLPKDSKTPTTVGKVNILSKTSTSTSDTKILKQDEMRGSIADKTKKTVVAEKSVGGFSSFETNLEKNTKIGNGNTPGSSGDCKKLSATGTKSDISLIKDSTVTMSSSSKNKDKTINAVSSLSSNKQLQRQKKATVEDISESDINVKSVDRGKVDSVGLKDQSDKISLSVKTATESKPKNTMSSQSLPKTTVDSRSMVTMTSGKSSTVMEEKSSLLTSVPTTLPSIAFSAKISSTASKIVSEKDNSKDIIKKIGESTKPASTIKFVKKETVPDVKKGIDNKTVSAQSAKLQETGQSSKIPSASKLDLRVASTALKSDSQKSTPSVTSSVSSSSGSTGKQSGLTSQALSASKSSITMSGKSTVTTTQPSSSSSAKALITSNKKIDPIVSERNKDSRA